MLDRYQGKDGRRVLIEALRSQAIAGGDEALAAKLADAASLEEVQPRQTMIEQGASDNDLILIVAGSVGIYVNKRQVGERRSGQHVGEMAMIDVSASRAASVVAHEATVVARIPETAMAAIADQHPRIWRCMAIELCKRLRERSKFIQLPNEKPHVFIGSSREALLTAQALEAGLKEAGHVVRIWTSGVFEASATAIEALDKLAKEVDFAVLVFSPDDQVTSRGKDHSAPRDNIIFELGLGIGALGRARTFFVLPRGLDIKIPSDLFGVTPITYDPAAGDFAAQLAPACMELLQCIERRGVK